MNIKRITLATLMVALLTNCAKAATEVVDGLTWKYTISGGKATITGCTKPVGVISIPSTLGGCPVTEIGNSAFRYCDDITGVVIPNTVTAIRKYAFGWCDGLTEITIPDSVTTIEDASFYVSSVRKINLGNSTATFNCGAGAVLNRSLTEFTVSSDNPRYTCRDGVLFSKDMKTLWVFPSGKSGAYVIPDGVVEIKKYAFGWCHYITEVTIPESVTTIEDVAFYVSSVRKINLGNCAANFDCGAGAVLNDNLTDFTVSSDNPRYTCCDGVLFSKDMKTLWVFPSGKSGAYAIPNGVTEIKEYAFGWCEGVMSVYVPDSVTTIARTSFYCCKAKSIRLPKSFEGRTSGLYLPSTVVFGGEWDGTGDDQGDGNITPVQGTVLSGTQEELSSVLTKMGSPYTVRGRYGIPTGRKLIVEPGVSLIFEGGASLFAEGTLTMNGTADEPIVCMGAEAGAGYWDGIFLKKANATLEFVNVYGATTGLDISETSPAVENCIFAKNRTGLNFANTRAMFINCLVCENEVNGAHHEYALPTKVSFTHCSIIDNGNWGVDCGYCGSPTFESCVISGNGNSGIQTYLYDCVVTAHGCVITGNGGYDVEHNAGTVLDFTGNWWGEETTRMLIEHGGDVNLPNIKDGRDTNGGNIVNIGSFLMEAPKGCGTTLSMDGGHGNGGGDGDAPDFSAALDSASLVFSTSGEAEWTMVDDADAVGGTCARSGRIGDSESTWLETFVSGPGAISFCWRVSSQARFDRLTFSVDGAAKTFIAGTAASATNWTAVSFEVEGEGRHTLRWTYAKSPSGSAGKDCGWLDDVRWAEAVPESSEYGEALDTPDLEWTGGGAGADAWVVVDSPTFDGEDASAAFAKGADGIARIATTVEGAGTVSFRWCIESGRSFAGIAFMVDGEDVEYCESEGWALFEYAVSGDGRHTLAWEYFWDGVPEGDAGFLDRVSWVPDAPESIAVGNVPVPTEWLDRFPTLLAQHHGSHVAAANAIAANGRTVADCFVAGLNPTNAAARFEARIDFVNGRPVVKWHPDLNNGGAKHERVYRTLGKRALADGWADVTDIADPGAAGYRFFKVKVKLP